MLKALLVVLEHSTAVRISSVLGRLAEGGVNEGERGAVISSYKLDRESESRFERGREGRRQGGGGGDVESECGGRLLGEAEEGSELE